MTPTAIFLGATAMTTGAGADTVERPSESEAPGMKAEPMSEGTRSMLRETDEGKSESAPKDVELGTCKGAIISFLPAFATRKGGFFVNGFVPRRRVGAERHCCLVAMFRAAVLLLALVAHADCLKPAEAPRSAVRRHVKPELRPELKPSLVPRSEHVLVAAKTEVCPRCPEPDPHTSAPSAPSIVHALRPLRRPSHLPPSSMHPPRPPRRAGA